MSGPANPNMASGKALGPHVSPTSARSWDVICIGQTSLDTIHMDEGECAQRVGGTLKYEKQNLCELRVSDRITRFLTESQIPRNYYQAKFFYLTPTPAALLCDVANEAFAKGARVVFTPKEDFPSVGKPRTLQRLLAKCVMCLVYE